MAQHDPQQALTQFYDTHTVNEALILARLRRQGVSLDALSEDLLKDHDMDHVGGAEAVDILAQKAGIHTDHYVLDVGSGLGGPARYLAHRYGCRVMGLDLTESRYHSALRLTRMVKLDHLVAFRLGNALAMPFPDHTFDVVVSQQAWVHIPDKTCLLAECARVLVPGGRLAFTDFLRQPATQPADLARLQHYWGHASLETLASYGQLLAAAGFTLLEQEDVSHQWAGNQGQRSEALRQQREALITQFGEDYYRRAWEIRQCMYELYTTGKLGGGQFIARLEAPQKP